MTDRLSEWERRVTYHCGATVPARIISNNHPGVWAPYHRDGVKLWTLKEISKDWRVGESLVVGEQVITVFSSFTMMIRRIDDE